MSPTPKVSWLKGKIGDSLATAANTISFAENANILVNLAGREDLRSLAKSDNPYVVAWDDQPQAVTFNLDGNTKKIFHLIPDETGLKLIFVEGTLIMFR